jgi:hypothetical protein
MKNLAANGTRHIAATVFVALAVAVPQAAIAVQRWERAYQFGTERHPRDAFGNGVGQTPDGGYVVAGSVRCSLLLLRVDYLGDTLWTRFYFPAGALQAVAKAMIVTTDGGILAAGNIATRAVMWAYWFRTDSLGDSLWAIAVPAETKGGWLNAVARTSAGDYIGVGAQLIDSTGAIGVLVSRVSEDGTSCRSWVYPMAGDPEGYCVCETPDHKFIVGGVVSVGLQNCAFLMCTDSQGNLLWTRTYRPHDPDDSGVRGIYALPDTTMMICGTWMHWDRGDRDFWLVRVDSDGDSLWSRWYGTGGTSNDQGCTGLVSCPHGQSVLYGQTCDTASGTLYDAWLVKVDSLGDVIWTRRYGGWNWEAAMAGNMTADEGYIFTGFSSSNDARINAVYLIKTDENGEVGLQEKARRQTTPSRASWNPFVVSPVSTRERMSYFLPSACLLSLEIYDITGRRLGREPARLRSEGRNEMGIPTPVTPGTYMIRLRSGRTCTTRRIVVECP